MRINFTPTKIILVTKVIKTIRINIMIIENEFSNSLVTKT